MGGDDHYFVIMVRTKQSCRRVPPYDPHVAMVATRGQVRIVEEATQPHADVDPKIDQGAESLNAKSDLEEAALVILSALAVRNIILESAIGRHAFSVAWLGILRRTALRQKDKNKSKRQSLYLLRCLPLL
uniref:Uncharacterized protein n=1 Tax=Cannabis sativa TaxID=3483 RepID=A0A803PRX6_CANSA